MTRIKSLAGIGYYHVVENLGPASAQLRKNFLVMSYHRRSANPKKGTVQGVHHIHLTGYRDFYDTFIIPLFVLLCFSALHGFLIRRGVHAFWQSPIEHENPTYRSCMYKILLASFDLYSLKTIKLSITREPKNNPHVLLLLLWKWRWSQVYGTYQRPADVIETYCDL